VRRHLGEAVYETVIPRSVRLSEAPSHGLPIALYSPVSKGAVAYARFASEFRGRLAASGRLGKRPGAGPGLPPSPAAATRPVMRSEGTPDQQQTARRPASVRA
jgi:hypothetical protein